MPNDSSSRTPDPKERLDAEYEERRRKAMAMGGPEKLARRREAGVLNARERVDYLCDPGSFLESGLFATSMTAATSRRATARSLASAASKGATPRSWRTTSR
jgi:acetyl-CoA carboxylase carboxyltransferase component